MNSSPAAALNVSAVRRKFPAIQQKVNGKHPIYLDNPAGTQVPSQVIQAIRQYLVEANSNLGGFFHTSLLSDKVLADARQAMADFINAPSPNEIVFGPNMTTLTFAISRSIGRTLNRGDEIVVTRMEHDANAAPWLALVQDRGVKVKWADFDVETGLLDMAHLEKQITARTKLVACTYASNALGTINDAKRVTELAHQAGAWSFIDAVHYGPHGPIDVQALDCDFLVCSSYKFFGPHQGILYGKTEHLEALPAYKVRPASDDIPDKWETGTQCHETIAGITATIDYINWIGETYGSAYAKQVKGYRGRRKTLKLAMAAIGHYERTLAARLVEGLSSIKKVHISGITEVEHFAARVPTVVFTVEGKSPDDVAKALGKAGIYVWSGNYYALAVMERLGMEDHGGMVRVGAVHYNTRAEIDTFVEAVEKIAG